MFDDHYNNWRETRINKLVSILGGSEWFNGKTVLELGCGYADIGNTLYKYGADVVVADGRKEHLEVVSSRHPHLKTIHINQDENWNLNQKFDIIIHWGVMYHLKPSSISRDIANTLMHTDIACFETEVSDSNDPNFCPSISESGFDQAISEIGSKPSVALVEAQFVANNFSFVRYDDADINSSSHHYDWFEKNDKSYTSGKRRFWLVKRIRE